jgi:hypothetical protein
MTLAQTEHFSGLPLALGVLKQELVLPPDWGADPGVQKNLWQAPTEEGALQLEADRSNQDAGHHS